MSGAEVWLSRSRIGGKPCIYGHRLSTRQVASLVWSGGLETMHRGWPYLSDAQILGACWFEVTYGKRKRWRKQYADWPKRYNEREWLAR